MTTKTVAQKLLIKPGARVWVSHAARQEVIDPLPEGADRVENLGQATVGVVFVDDARSEHDSLDAQREHLTAPDILWVAYPKANRVDINRDTLWPIVGGYGLRPISQVAIDEVWSALRFRPLKEGEAPFAPGQDAAVSR